MLACGACVAACSGTAQLGDACGDSSDCGSSLQCLAKVCVPTCERATDCGDGYACNVEHECVAATGGPGDLCASEVSCAAGYSCQIDGKTTDPRTGLLRASCTPQNGGTTRSAGAACASDGECRNGTCALGHCVDLCSTTVDCGPGTSCMKIPRLESNGELFAGCLPSTGTLVWDLDVHGAYDDSVRLPVPDMARSVELVMSVPDPTQRVGAEELDDGGDHLYTAPCAPGYQCSADIARDQFFKNVVRHEPGLGQSALEIVPRHGATADQPVNDWRLPATAYKLVIASHRADGSPGATPRATAIVSFGPGRTLDLHFFFLDLDAHPCAASFGTLNAATAPTAPYFKNAYIGELRSIFAHHGISIGDITYEDVVHHDALAGLDIADAGKLLSLGKYATGINVFFVRSLSPAGLQAYAPNPGPAGLAGTPQSGIILNVETLCYRDWAPKASSSSLARTPATPGFESSLARTTAHEIARYMGLFHNIEADFSADHPTWRDGLDDNDADQPNTNLMYFSEFGGIELSPRQRDVLTRSGVLR